MVDAATTFVLPSISTSSSTTDTGLSAVFAVEEVFSVFVVSVFLFKDALVLFAVLFTVLLSLLVLAVVPVFAVPELLPVEEVVLLLFFFKVFNWLCKPLISDFKLLFSVFSDVTCLYKSLLVLVRLFT